MWQDARTMASSNVIELTDQNFQQEVLQSELPVLIDFWAVWCGPCKQIAPIIDAMASDYAGKLKIGKLDVDRHQVVAQQLRVTSIPALFLFKGGKVVWNFAGAAPRTKIEAEVKKHLP
jgi:thioredoxin 1